MCAVLLQPVGLGLTGEASLLYPQHSLLLLLHTETLIQQFKGKEFGAAPGNKVNFLFREICSCACWANPSDIGIVISAHLDEITFAFFCARGIEGASGVGFEAGGMAQVAGYSWAFSARLQCPQG